MIRVFRISPVSLLQFIVLFLFLIPPAHADQVLPTSYDMINGRTTDLGYHVRDNTYTGGTGNPGVDYSTLAGGKGDLTDGILASGSWFQSQTAANPYVGWKDNYLQNPTITFHFGSQLTFTQVSVRMVQQYRPGSVDITVGNNSPVNFTNFDQWGPAGWEWVDFTLNSLSGDTVVLRLNDNTLAWNTDWIMIDEVTFQGYSSTVPESATMLLLGLGLIGVAGVRRIK